MTRIWKHMNPSANEFIPDLNVSYDISTNHLTTKQKNILLEIISKWTTTPTLDDLLLRREERSKQTKGRTAHARFEMSANERS
ncbi:unnamed protein product [Rotaria magnacalcarata]|uniref:Uncharacterized protein n=1 Tax=Rotaria magnacalcarata TaxID=392030 RepID=A0A8S3ITC2_9BILA|nr:unnamed protein product [Rotaria magnacalcarata]CAF5205605.1 unnamed protein product [Rotaria magnacalcarata]CAF5207000.1 unnamed protein product [Rotaria magnacalcarata]